MLLLNPLPLCTIGQTVWEVVLPDTEFIQSIKIFTPFTFFMTAKRRNKHVKIFWKNILILSTYQKFPHHSILTFGMNRLYGDIFWLPYQLSYTLHNWMKRNMYFGAYKKSILISTERMFFPVEKHGGIQRCWIPGRYWRILPS